MPVSRSKTLLFASFFILALLPTARAETPVIYTMGGQSASDQRLANKLTILNKLIEVTKDKYGPLDVKVTPLYMERDRELVELADGKDIQVSIQSPHLDWETKTHTIFIPTDKGMTGCKIFLIRKESQAEFDKIQTIDDLKKIPLGVNAGWTTTTAMQAAGFNLVAAPQFEGLFPMLMSNRFDGIVRGVNEVWGEYDARKATYPDLAIEQHMSLRFPNPQYIFVTPNRPDLAKRFEEGMKIIMDNGDLDAILAPQVAKADYKHRKVFYLDSNAALTSPGDIEAMGIKKYWFHP